MILRNLGQLVRVLAQYDPRLPVRFVSGEPGGHWPEGGNHEHLVCDLDEAVAIVHVPGSGPNDHSNCYVQVMLFNPKK